MNKWQDWVNFVLGLWVIVSPWTIEHIMASPGTSGGVTETAMWNHYVIGTVVVILAVAAVSAFNAWIEWTNIVLGAWLAVSPWGLGYSASPGLMWNAVITGLLIIAFAGWALGEEQASGQLAKSKRQ